ncbi:acyl carrier protein [Rariglobus hedericola]|uniref:Acyl carrier protein n=1 Tax=Rariglobus hedericola TaxID=2597822 RepID=A0A556QND0_9BACT|nr:acyl carrier protein [Rariglobus hedericola]TSJ78112.1 acyl carrier protein [Rariglobus hedericola]
MSDDSTTPPSAPAPKPVKRSPLEKFSLSVRDAHTRFMTTGDVEALDLVVLAIVHDHQPMQVRAASPADLSNSAKLIGDLGFDSLALAEIVFFIEDLYQVSVSNEEIMAITTVGELRDFVRVKVAALLPSQT